MTQHDRFELCMRTENIFLPRNGYFGVSAATGGLAGTVAYGSLPLKTYKWRKVIVARGTRFVIYIYILTFFCQYSTYLEHIVFYNHKNLPVVINFFLFHLFYFEWTLLILLLSLCHFDLFFNKFVFSREVIFRRSRRNVVQRQLSVNRAAETGMWHDFDQHRYKNFKIVLKTFILAGHYSTRRTEEVRTRIRKAMARLRKGERKVTFITVLHGYYSRIIGSWLGIILRF